MFYRDLTSKGVLQLFPSDVLLIDGNTVILQVYVLETFVSPLRVYRHNEGLVIFADKGKVCSHEFLGWKFFSCLVVKEFFVNLVLDFLKY